MEAATAHEHTERIISELNKVVVGQDDVVAQVVAVLLAGGHALLEGVPGTAKTLIARALAAVSGASFRRIQFTPDLMPTDILGVSVYEAATAEFRFRPGPIFSDIVLADEINRSPAKTQAALLEVMEEHRASVDGVTHDMSKVFTVLATQNPVEFEGTYPLPEAQVDRFMAKILVGYPAADTEAQILDRLERGFDPADLATAGLSPVLDVELLSALRGTVRATHAEEKVRRYVTDIVRATRTHPAVSLGASPRASVLLLQLAKAFAILARREFVTPDDVKRAVPPALRHRLLLLPEVEVEGGNADACLRDVLEGIEVPR